MKRTLLAFLIPLFLFGCGKAEQEATKQVLMRAYTVKALVPDLENEYSKAFSSKGWDGVITGWEGVQNYRTSPSGKTSENFLQPYSKPLNLDVSFRRFNDLKELSVTTAEYVNLAIEPRGTWGSFQSEMNSIRTRFERALLSLETGAKDYVVTEAKGEAANQIKLYNLALSTAVAKADEEAARQRAEMLAAEEQAQKNRLADLARQEQLTAERKAAERQAYPVPPTPVPLDIRRSNQSPQAPEKLSGGPVK